MIVVADSSPLIILAKLGCFDLLKRLFSRIYISAEVSHEVVVAGAGLPGSSEVANAIWVETKKLADTAELSIALSKHPLGAGELSTILLAKQLRADAVLIDDHRARTLARAEGLQISGSVGLLETFYARDYLPDLRGAFLQLLTHNAYVDPRLLDLRLRSLGIPPL